MPPSVTEKRCSRCKETKPADQFHRHRRTKDGLNTWCKACRGEHARAINLTKEYSVTVSEKRCGHCAVVKSADQFHVHKRHKTGLASWCKACTSENNREINRNRDFCVTVSEKRCPRCKTVKPADQFKRNRMSKTGLSSWCKICDHRCSTYGSAFDYERLFRDQGGRCAICTRIPDIVGTLQVDHDHDTGEVRALLCRDCNLMIGFARECPDALVRAATYLGYPFLTLLLAMG